MNACALTAAKNDELLGHAHGRVRHFTAKTKTPIVCSYSFCRLLAMDSKFRLMAWEVVASSQFVH